MRHANELWDTYGIAVHAGRHQKADLIFFSRTGLFPTHIGIVRDEESYIHAPGRDNTKIKVEPIVYESIVPRGAIRAIYSKNPIGFKSPSRVIEQPTYRYHQTPIE